MVHVILVWKSFRDISGAHIQDVIYVNYIESFILKNAALLSLHSGNNLYYIGIASGQQIIFFSPQFSEFEM